jgi:hypothetical protein
MGTLKSAMNGFWSDVNMVALKLPLAADLLRREVGLGFTIRNRKAALNHQIPQTSAN